MSTESQSALVVALVGGSHFVNHSYFMLLPPIFGPLGEQVGLTDPQLGVALGTVGVVVTALQIPLGHVSDTYGRTPVLALSLTFGAIGAAMTALADSYFSLLAAQVVVGIGIAGHHPAHYPLIGAVTNDATRGRAYSVHGFTGALGFAAPPAVVAGAAALGFDWRVAIGAIAAVGAVYGVGCLLTFRRRVDRAITHPTRTGNDQDKGDGSGERNESGTDGGLLDRLRRVRPSTAILALTVLWFATSVAGWGIKQYTATLLSANYGAALSTANIAVSAMLVVGAVLIFGGGWLTDRYDPVWVLAAGYTALVAVAGLLAWGGLPVAAALGLVLVLSATVDASRPARASLADEFSTADSAGKNFGLLTIGISGGAAVAPPVLGVVVSRSGVEAAFVAIAAVGVVALALTAVVVRLGKLSVHPFAG